MPIIVVSTTKANTLSVTIPATTAHNCLVVCINSFAGTAQSVSGVTLGVSAGNFAQATAAGGTASHPLSAIWVDRDCAGGQTAVVVSGSGLSVNTSSGGVTVFEISGLDTVSPLDVFNPGTGSSAAFSSGLTGTTAQPSEIWVGTADVSGAPAGPALPWVNTVNTGSFAISGTNIVSSTGTATYAGTATSGVWSAVVITLKAAAPPGPPSIFTPPALSTRGQRARRGSSSSSRGAPVILGPPAPAPFVIPALSTRGQRARRGSSSSSRGAPVRATPAPFVLPLRASRGQLPRRGRIVGPGLYSAGSPPPPVIPTLLVALAAAAGVDDYGTPYPKGIYASEGVIQGPTIIGSNAFYYDPSPGFGALTQSISDSSSTDQYGNAYISGTATYLNAGSFWVAVVIDGGTVTWYKATGAGGPWTIETSLGFTFNALTGGGLVINAPAGISGSFQIPQPSPAATSAAIISALFNAGIFN